MENALFFFGGVFLGMIIMTVFLSAKSVYLQNKIELLEKTIIKLRKSKRK